MEQPIKRPEKIKLTEINSYLTCYLCKGYLIDATTISECLHSFCRSCIIKFLQDNSYCPICEVIINKAKPNLKLDKTLQDIVYKLVPELFLKEMTRRKQYYQQYPQIAARVSPEERGEDTERTIFNPQDCISLSMEYVSSDSSPGAIKLPLTKNGFDKSDQLSSEDNQTHMKRYLQCPGMCRVDVLKKFVRNKYNVDTTLFHIDILYKRVPLPDHYTLIDIAYIYSWKRNEPMKFFFRITDLNKVSERFDYFDSRKMSEVLVPEPLKSSRNNGAAMRRKEHVKNRKNSKANKQQEIQVQSNGCDKIKSEKITKTLVDKEDAGSEARSKLSDCDKNLDAKSGEQKLNSNKENVKTKKEINADCDSHQEESPKRFILKIKKDPEKDNAQKADVKTTNSKVAVTNPSDLKDCKNGAKPEVSGHLKLNIQNQQNDVKNSVYTNITLNRTNNVEIITKIQKVSDKDGQSIGFNIIKQTVKSNDLKNKKKSQNDATPLKIKPKSPDNKNEAKNNVSEEVNEPNTSTNTENKEKLEFLETFKLIPKTSLQCKKPLSKETPQKEVTTKRKPSTSPTKQSSSKKPKLETKPVTRIILHTKPKPSPPKQAGKLATPGLQSLIENCKIPSSLSITLKDSSESTKPTPMIPPVKNYIEILKLPEENKPDDTETKESNKLTYNFRINADSEQKVDEDLAEIAKSLTEKIPMSTTISQIIGPKPEFSIPVKTNVPPKFNVQPSPVPEITNKLLNVPKENKLNPRSPQSFQRIFEESIKKPDSACTSPEKGTQKSTMEGNNEVTSTSNNKRNIMEIASQLFKKTKMEMEKNISQNQIDSTTPKAIPKVPIPRLPNNKNSKAKTAIFDIPDKLKCQQTLNNLHSNALGLNYTISVGPTVSPKINGIISKKDVEIKPSADTPVKSPKAVETKTGSFLNPAFSPKPSPIPRNISPGLGYNSPRNSPKHSPKSSPMIKHMYAPMPNLMMDQLRVNTYPAKLPSKIKSPHLPSSSTISNSPNTSSSLSPKPSSVSPKPSSVSPKPSSVSPKPSNVSPKPSCVSPKPSSVSPNPSVAPEPPSTVNTPQVVVPSKISPKPSSSTQSSPLSPNQILERYNIQNLAQLTANLNYNSPNFALNSGNQLAALQHAMLLKHFEIQNRQNWLSMNQGSLIQYEKYLANLQKTAQNHLLSKEN